MYPHVHTFHLHGMKSLQLFLRIGYPGAGYICNDFPVKEKSIAEQVQILLDIVLHFLHTHPGRSVLSYSSTKEENKQTKHGLETWD